MLEWIVAISLGVLVSRMIVWCFSEVCAAAEWRASRRKPPAPRTDFERWLAAWDRRRKDQARTTL